MLRHVAACLGTCCGTGFSKAATEQDNCKRQSLGMHLYLHTAVRSPQLCQHVCIIRAALLRPPVLWFGVRFCRLLCLPLHHSTSNFAMKSFPNRFHTVLFCATPCHGGAQGHHRATPQNGGGPASVGDTRPITLSSTVLISGSRSSCSFAGGAHTGRPTAPMGGQGEAGMGGEGVAGARSQRSSSGTGGSSSARGPRTAPSSSAG